MHPTKGMKIIAKHLDTNEEKAKEEVDDIVIGNMNQNQMKMDGLIQVN